MSDLSLQHSTELSAAAGYVDSPGRGTAGFSSFYLPVRNNRIDRVVESRSDDRVDECSDTACHA